MNIEINWCIDIHILHLIPFRLISANEFIIKPIFVRMAKYFLCIHDQANLKKKGALLMHKSSRQSHNELYKKAF